MLIDLTLHLHKDHPVFEYAKQQALPHIAAGHIGTHLDIPSKTSIPLEYFKSVGVIFDVRNIQEVTLAHIDIEKVTKGSFVLFCTGRIKEHAYGSDEYGENHPYLSHELIDALLAREIHFIGVDCPGIRQHAEHKAADIKCEEHHTYVIENMVNLEELINHQNFTVYTAWLDDDERTGLPCRIIAEI